ncbi:MAG: NTP transferase domain-containing protein [Acidobacteriota bacterium]
MTISAVVLAAGQSQRMGGSNKLLLPLGKETLVERIVGVVSASGASEVIVVLGYQASRVRKVLKQYPVTPVENERYTEGMTTSIQAGVRAVSLLSQAVMICLCDLPLIVPDELKRLMEAFRRSAEAKSPRIIVPVFQGQRGNPVILPIRFRADILRHRGLAGCRGVVTQNPDQVLEVEMSTNHVVDDMDTREDYDRVRKLLESST